MKASGILCILLFCLLGFIPFTGDFSNGGSVLHEAYAQENWKSEFEEICGKTQDAMVYSAEELRLLINRCDRIKPAVERLEQTQRKVYLRRLQMCRELFVFALESKEKK